MKKTIIIGLIAVILLTGCTRIPTMENGDEIVAEIDGKQISTSELYNEIKEDYGTNYLINMLDNYILSKEFSDEDEATTYAEETYAYYETYYKSLDQDFEELVITNYGSVASFKSLLINDYKREQVAKKYVKNNLTEEEKNAYYESDIYGTMTVRHILIIPDTTSTMTDAEKATAEEEAFNTAKELINKLNNGEDFSTLATTYSEDTGTASNGGLFENFSKDTTDSAFWQASYNLEDNKYTLTPVESTYGYHIILKISSSEKPSIEEALETIENALVDEKMSEDNAIDKYWVEIRKSYNLTIYDTDIQSSYNETINTIE